MPLIGLGLAVRAVGVAGGQPVPGQALVPVVPVPLRVLAGPVVLVVAGAGEPVAGAKPRARLAAGVANQPVGASRSEPSGKSSSRLMPPSWVV
jgi:hypothetical protein